MSVKMEQMQRDLDATINQKLKSEFTDQEGSAAEKHKMRRKSTEAIDIVSISNFARHLTQNLCLEVLLFWKAVEQYKTLFSSGERRAISSKLFDMYCEEGAPRQVNFRGDHVKTISERMKEKDLQEDLFDEAQFEVYELMRLDLWPRYHEEMEEKRQGISEAEEAVAESLGQVLKGTHPPASRHFSRFAAENFLDEALNFWLDVNDYNLMFQKQDMITKGNYIYDTYMSMTAKFKVNVSDSLVAECKRILDMPLEETVIDGGLFIKAQKEVEQFLQLDVFPRYQEWAHGDGKIGASIQRQSTSDSLLDESILGDREKMRAAVQELLTIPSEVDNFRDIGRAAECAESIDFYLEVKEYKLLFDTKDMKDKANIIWKKYLDDKSDTMINMPDRVRKDLEKIIVKEDFAKGSAKTFDKALKETLHLITDNIYPTWLQKYKKDSDAGAAAQPAPAPAPPPKASGGCCVIS